MQAGGADDENEADEGDVAEAGEVAAQGADVAAVEGMLSGLALSDSGAESAAAAAPSLLAADFLQLCFWHLSPDEAAPELL